jgi:PHD/YefM family antitoxin component YafN of YafNO toxin-antitoxin module
VNRRVDILDLADEARDLVRDSEVGRRTVVTRDGREVAIVISFDEYVALRETVAISGNQKLRERIAQADREAFTGAFIAPEELFGLEGQFGNDRLRLTDSAVADFSRLANDGERLRALFTRIDLDPLSGVPLFDPLRPWWSCREGDLRIVYRVAAEGRIIAILAIDSNQA